MTDSERCYVILVRRVNTYIGHANVGLANPKMDFNQLSTNIESRSAPWHNVPRVPVVGIEHPCLLTDLGRAMDTLGGPKAISKLIGDQSASVEANFHLHPGNRNSKPISSFNTKTGNVLLKITVPKKTGRKRKRGSDGDFLEDLETPSSKLSLLSNPDDARALFQNMRGNSDRYRVEAVGSVQQTHRFRRECTLSKAHLHISNCSGLPDFVWSTQNSPFMAKMKEHILPFEYPKLKDFKFDMSKGVQEENDIPPPPQWTRHHIPLNYSYGRIPRIKDHAASADLSAFNDTQTIGRNKLFMLTHDTLQVPAAPSTTLPPESSLTPPLRNLIAAMREIFVRRPICTRRAVQNTVPADIWKAVGPNSVKHLWQYIGFLWTSGPWRDTICAFGVDPRKNSAMRWYQTMVFQVESDSKEPHMNRSKVKSRIDSNLAAKAEVRDGHLFNGKTIRLDGKVWQMCDISDPLLKSLVDTDVLRDGCDTVSDGWYPNGTLAKIKVITKAKVSAILAGEIDDEQLEDELLRLHQKVPSILTEKNRAEAIFEKGTASARMVKWADTIRTSATRPGGKTVAWGPATAKSRANARASAAKKTVASRRGKGRGGRPRKKRGGARNDSLGGRDGAVNEQNMIDPRLRNAAGDLEDVEREAALREFEDDAEESHGESSSSGSSESESLDEESDDEQSDTDDSDNAEGSRDGEGEESVDSG
ncbi:MAG: hypothetical protein Q9216_004727 [Gyalolechia sp. 2 TL-2023]